MTFNPCGRPFHQPTSPISGEGRLHWLSVLNPGPPAPDMNYMRHGATRYSAACDIGGAVRRYHGAVVSLLLALDLVVPGSVKSTV